MNNESVKEKKEEKGDVKALDKRYKGMVMAVNSGPVKAIRKRYEPQLTRDNPYPPIDDYIYREGSFESDFPEQNIIRYNITRLKGLEDRELPLVLYFHG